jgi:hypothetical protein
MTPDDATAFLRSAMPVAKATQTQLVLRSPSAASSP